MKNAFEPFNGYPLVYVFPNQVTYILDWGFYETCDRETATTQGCHLGYTDTLNTVKRLIKSATTVLNRAQPRNGKLIAARSHKGKWLFCAKEPPKTENEEKVYTKHQRKHVRNVKLHV